MNVVMHACTLQMKVTYNDDYMITVSEDATVMVWRVSDKEGRGLKRGDKELGWAEEILITKTDLEEKVISHYCHNFSYFFTIILQSSCITIILLYLLECPNQ